MFWVWRAPKALLAAAVAGTAAALAAGVAAGFAAVRPLELAPKDAVVFPMGAVVFEATAELREARVRVEPPVPFTYQVSGRSILLRPSDPLRPGGTYAVEVEATDTAGRSIRRVLPIRVQPLSDAFWVYVKLDSLPHRVYVYRGDELVRSMVASGGRPGFETPEGVFRIQNRGYHFFSQKYQEGAYYWVRIIGNYLFHSVPVDAEGNVIEEEAKKLGCPASHGCVRLSFPDAKWLYDHVPDGAWVVIDRT